MGKERFKQVDFEYLYRKVLEEQYAAFSGMKTARVLARQALPGETVVTTVYDVTTGSLIEEASVVANTGDILVGQEIMANLDLTWFNSYVVSADKFKKLYKVSEETWPSAAEKWYEPIPAPKLMYQVNENLAFPYPSHWGQEGWFYLQAGGVLVPENDKEFYGINPYELASTYSLAPLGAPCNM